MRINPKPEILYGPSIANYKIMKKLKNQGGELFTGTMVVLAFTALAGAVYLMFLPPKNLNVTNELNLGAQVLTVRQGGTGENEFASSTLLMANGTDKLTGTSTPTADSFHATSTTITSEIEGTLKVNNLTVTGTCTGCDATFANDLQDTYNNAGVDAQITTADAKDVIVWLQDTATDPNFYVLSAPEGQGRLVIGTADGTATTTTALWETYGALGIGTTTPGAGLSVGATTTNLSSLTVEGFGKIGALTATNTLDYLGSATSTWASAGISVAGGGLASSRGLTLTGGDIQSAGKITITSTGTSTIPLLTTTSADFLNLLITGDLNNTSLGTSTFSGGIDSTNINLTAGLVVGADSLFTGKLTSSSAGTSTLPALNVSTALTAVNLQITGDLNVDVGTSTLQGATFAGLFTTNGLHVSTGDGIFGQVIKVGSGTSTIAGTLEVQSTTGTSTFTGPLFLSKLLQLKGGGAVNTCVDISATGVVDGATSNCFYLTPTTDLALTFDNLNQDQKLTLKGYLGTSGSGGDISISFPSTSPAIYEYSASSTIRNIGAGGGEAPYFRCAGEVNATSTTLIFLSCLSQNPFE